MTTQASVGRWTRNQRKLQGFPKGQLGAGVLYALSFTPRWQAGWRRLADAAKGPTLPEGREAVLPGASIPTTEPIAPAALDPVERRIMDYIAAGDGHSTAEIAAQAGLSTCATQHRLAALAERGLVVVVGSGLRDPRRRWYAMRKDR